MPMARFPFFKRKLAPLRHHAVPTGRRIYAIGDVHGRLDCLDALIAQTDDESTGAQIILLGDLIDRGPQSRGVVERAMELGSTRGAVLLMGNHEEVLIKAWEGDAQAARLLHRIGGRATLLSYGVDADAYDRADIDELLMLIATAIPAEHIQFLRRGADQYQVGDYLFVHAGIRPGVELARQAGTDLRWIRDEFLDDARQHDAMIVHGHTVTASPDLRANRIGIDTGAFATGRLTALGLEGTRRWLLTT